MLYLRSWLEEYINLNSVSNEKLAEILSLKSGEVEEISEIKDYFEEKVVVGKIENLRKHPDADRLQIFDVNLGARGKAQIISAATNVREGLICPVGTIGAKLPFFNVVERKMRGQSSFGICLGKSELMLETEMSEGLWELESELDNIISDKNNSFEKYEDFLGLPICQVFPEYFEVETVFEIKYLQDKIGFLGNHLGLAIDLAICLEDLNLLKPKAKKLLSPEEFWLDFQKEALNLEKSENEINFKDSANYTKSFFLLDLDLNPGNNPEFSYNLPHLYQKRMFLTGKNLIGGIADLSNYLMNDVGQPSHFFSTEKLLKLANKQGLENTLTSTWEIKTSEKETIFFGLGQLKKTNLSTSVPALFQQQEIIALPGISGSESTKMEASENKIVIEIANFFPEKTSQASFNLNYRSDGARLWNSGVNPTAKLIWLINFIEALKLNYNYSNFSLKYISLWLNKNLAEFKNISPALNLLEASRQILFSDEKKIIVDFNYLIKRLDNQSISSEVVKIEKYLNLIGDYKFGFLYPHKFYSGLQTQDDLLFEIVRLIGFGNLKNEYLNVPNNLLKNNKHKAVSDLKNLFISFGFDEVLTRPFLCEDKNIQFLEDKKAYLQALNAQSQNESFLRTNLLPSLLSVLNENILRGQKEIQIFEFGKLYSIVNSKLQEEVVIESLCLLEDPYLLTSLLQSLSQKISSTDLEIQNLQAQDIGSGYEYNFKNGVSGKLLEISKGIKKKFELPLNKKVWYLQLNLTNWDYTFKNYKKYFDESNFPVVKRAYSVKINKEVFWNEIENLLSSQKISEARISIVPVEKMLINNQEVLNFEVEFVSYIRTLTAEEIVVWEEKAFASLGKNFGITLR